MEKNIVGGRYVGSVKVAIVSGIEYGDSSGGGGGVGQGRK